MRPLTATTQVMAMVIGPATTTRLTPIVISTNPIAPLVDTGCGRTRGTVPPLTPLSDAIFHYGPAQLVPGVIGGE
jgi:hypothetical protein